MLNSSEIIHSELYSMSHPQKRIWYMEKIYPNTSAYNICGFARVKCQVNFKLLEEAINVFIQKNEGIRLKFINEGDQVKQYVGKFKKIFIDFLDFSSFENPEYEFERWIKNNVKTPLKFESNELFYFAMFKISENSNGYFGKFHHIISDGWSLNIMSEQISKVYMKLLNNQDTEPIEAYSYLEYLENEKKYMCSDRFVRDKKYWKEMFEFLPELLWQTSEESILGERKSYKLNHELTSRIKEYVSSTKCTINSFFVALYLLYTSKVSQKKDIVIGTPVLNRSGKREKNMFGMFTSTMPFKFIIDEKNTVEEIIFDVNNELMQSFFHQKYPYDILAQDLELKKNGYDSLFNVCVNYYNSKLNSRINDEIVEYTEVYNGCQVYSLQLVIKEWGNKGEISLDFDYKTSDFTKSDIDVLYGGLVNLALNILSSPKIEMSKLRLISKEDEDFFIEKFNDSFSEYPKNKTVYKLFEEQTVRNPDNIAVSFEDKSITYHELNMKSNQLARLLITKGVMKDTIVAILTTHSIETVIAILAVIKSGGAYLPVDPGYPEERISYMLDDSCSSIILSNLDGSILSKHNREIINLKDGRNFSGDYENLDVVNKPDDMVYIIYTSGSTGKPKGTMIEHRGLVNYIWWAKKVYSIDDRDVFPLYSSLAFDLTVTSIFSPLVSGGQIIVYAENEDEHVLYRIIKENKCTLVKLTPAHLQLIKDMDNSLSSVKRFIVGGEDLKVSIAEKIHNSFKGQIEIFNEYGPTETVVGCMIHKYDYMEDKGVSVPIGVPADNVKIYILDSDFNPVPTGIVGEMYISGDGVAKGYLNREDLTLERFVSNPFNKEMRMYKTGDLARFTNNGKIEYVGRVDYQVKIRGYRIEFGEIENYILLYDSVKNAVVIDREFSNHEKYICAYVVKDGDFLEQELKDYLSKFLPEYMIPYKIIFIDDIPLTSNGKINRSLLPVPQISLGSLSHRTKPANEIEAALIDVVKNILDLERVGIDDDFLSLGGDSIKAILLSSKLSNMNLKLKVKDILSYPILADMAGKIENKVEAVESNHIIEGYIENTPIITWFFSQDFNEINHWNQSIMLSIDNIVTQDVIENALDSLIKRHDSFRLNFDKEKGRLFYNSGLLNSELKVSSFVVEECDDKKLQNIINDYGTKVKGSIDIRKDLLIRACIFIVNKNEKLLLLTAHHLAVDGVSWQIILEDLEELLGGLAKNTKCRFANKTDSFKKWSEGLVKYSNNEILQSEKEYWNQTENTDFDFLKCCIHNVVINNEDLLLVNAVKKSMIINCEDVDGILKVCKVFSINTGEFLTIALAITINKLTNKEQIVLELEGHGREELISGVDVTRTVGWFTSMYPVRLIINDTDLEQNIKLLKEQLRNIPNKGMGYGILKYMSKVLAKKQDKYLRFNYLGSFGKDFKNQLIKLSQYESGNDCGISNHMTSILDIIGIEIDGVLKFDFTYSKKIFDGVFIKSFMKRYFETIKNIIEVFSSKDDIKFTPSDFRSLEISQDSLDMLFD